jgi:circadian clock protein KaiB
MAGGIQYRLKLYVTGGTSIGEQAVAALRTLCRSTTQLVHAEVVDVLLHPEMLLDLASVPMPVLVRENPGPVRVVRGPFASAGEIASLLREE